MVAPKGAPSHVGIQTDTGGPISALSIPSFRWWFLGQVTSASGLMTQNVAVAWLILRWHGDGFKLALTTTASLAPMLVLGLWAGTVIDHHNRRSILILTQTLLAGVSLVLYAMIVTGTASYWPLVAVSLAGGIVNALDAPARQVYVIDLVGEERVAGAVSLFEIVLNLSRVFGPALGGALLALSGPAACVLVNALSFIAPVGVLLRHPKGSPRTRRLDEAERPRAREGVRYAWQNPLLRACLLLAVAAGVVFNFTVLLPLLAVRVFHLGAGGYGLLLALFGIGAIPGALMAARRQPTGLIVGTLSVLTAVAMGIAAVATVRMMLYVGIVLTGAASIWMIAAANTLVQLRTPSELRGRVMGAWSVALPGTVPITGLAIGAFADACGARLAYGVTGALLAAIALASWRSLTASVPV